MWCNPRRIPETRLRLPGSSTARKPGQEKKKSLSCRRLVKSWGIRTPRGGQTNPAHTSHGSLQGRGAAGRGGDLTRPPPHSPVPSRHSPDGAVGPGADRGEVLVALGHLPHRLVQLLPVELGPLLRHLGCGARPARPGGRGRLCPRLQQHHRRHYLLLLLLQQQQQEQRLLPSFLLSLPPLSAPGGGSPPAATPPQPPPAPHAPPRGFPSSHRHRGRGRARPSLSPPSPAALPPPLPPRAVPRKAGMAP